MLNLTLSKREKKLAGITSGIILLTVFFSFVLEPQIKKISEGKGLLKKLKLEEKKALQINQSRGAIEEKYLKLRKEIITQAPREEELSKLLSELENFTKATKIRPINIEPLPIKKYEFYRKLTVEMILQGDLAGLTKFLYNLQYSSYPFIIDKIIISSKSRQSKLLKVQVSVSILLGADKTGGKS